MDTCLSASTAETLCDDRKISRSEGWRFPARMGASLTPEGRTGVTAWACPFRSHPDAQLAHGHVSSLVSGRAMRGTGATLTCKGRAPRTARACPFTLFAMPHARHGYVRHVQRMPPSRARACPFALIRHPECVTWVHPSRRMDPTVDSRGISYRPIRHAQCGGTRVSVISNGGRRSRARACLLAMTKAPMRRMPCVPPARGCDL